MAPKPILIVEDDADIRENLRTLLEDEGFPVLDAPNGQEALKVLRRLGGQLPGLVFLDLQMPVMDGKAFLQEVEGDAQLSKLPVIVITAGGERIDKKIIALFKKPLDIDLILAAARKYSGES